MGGLGALPHLAWKLWDDDSDRAALELALRLSENPAQRLGQGHRKGALRPGLDADVVLLDSNGSERPIQSSFTDAPEPYPGFTSPLSFRAVFLRGVPVVEQDRLLDPVHPRGEPLQGPA